jgi:cytochrome c553
MKLGLRLAAQAAILAILAVVVSAAARADDRGSVQAKLEYCKICHGMSGQGYHGYLTMPRLAGQQPRYLENQMRAFAEHRRTSGVMSGVARSLSPSMIAALANHFRDLNPGPMGGGPRERLGLGRTIYQEGLPEANIPACSACHGPDARGQDEIPRLAGQLYPYVVKELTNWSRERGQVAKDDPSAVMVPTAHNLTQAQISAIAAYVSNLR